MSQGLDEFVDVESMFRSPSYKPNRSTPKMVRSETVPQRSLLGKAPNISAKHNLSRSEMDVIWQVMHEIKSPFTSLTLRQTLTNQEELPLSKSRMNSLLYELESHGYAFKLLMPSHKSPQWSVDDLPVRPSSGFPMSQIGGAREIQGLSEFNSSFQKNFNISEKKYPEETGYNSDDPDIPYPVEFLLTSQRKSTPMTLGPLWDFPSTFDRETKTHFLLGLEMTVYVNKPTTRAFESSPYFAVDFEFDNQDVLRPAFYCVTNGKEIHVKTYKFLRTIPSADNVIRSIVKHKVGYGCTQDNLVFSSLFGTTIPNLNDLQFLASPGSSKVSLTTRFEEVTGEKVSMTKNKSKLVFSTGRLHCDLTELMMIWQISQATLFYHRTGEKKEKAVRVLTLRELLFGESVISMMNEVLEQSIAEIPVVTSRLTGGVYFVTVTTGMSTNHMVDESNEYQRFTYRANSPDKAVAKKTAYMRMMGDLGPNVFYPEYQQLFDDEEEDEETSKARLSIFLQSKNPGQLISTSKSLFWQVCSLRYNLGSKDATTIRRKILKLIEGQ